LLQPTQAVVAFKWAVPEMKENGVASGANHVGKREVLMENMDGSPYEY
tara:strand:+ start:2139 stop:2282 length:144 start_codon:yes stop_codon:yes gene_type:complete